MRVILSKESLFSILSPALRVGSDLRQRGVRKSPVTGERFAVIRGGYVIAGKTVSVQYEIIGTTLEASGEAGNVLLSDIGAQRRTPGHRARA